MMPMRWRSSFVQLAQTSFDRSARFKRHFCSQAVLVSDNEGGDSQLNAEQLAYKKALSHADYFGVKDTFTVDDMLKARVHFGHKVGTLDERMEPFLFGHRLGICIFDLNQTSKMMMEALNFLAHVVYRNGIVLFASQHRPTMHLVERAARLSGEYCHCRRWQPGLLTDSAVRFGCQIRLPDVIILTHTMNNLFETHEIVVEAAKMAIPIIGIVDSNCNPNPITYPIPGNDDSPPSVAFYLSTFQETIGRGKKRRSEDWALLGRSE